MAKNYKMKILIQTRETGISQTFGFESDVNTIIMKSLES